MSGAVFVGSAQNRSELDKVRTRRDSLAEVLTEQRTEYLRNEARRKALTPSILTLEKELAVAQQAYEVAVANIAKHDVEVAIADYEKAKANPAKQKGEKKTVEESAQKSPIYTPDKSRMRRNLVSNDYFAERLSESDLKTLRDAQYRESEVKRKVEVFMKQYANLLTLHRKYMEVNTRVEADSLQQLFNVKKEQMQHTGRELETVWNSLYYNKMYIYDLLMERDANSAMLDLSASSSASAEREINGASDLYESNMLVGYYARKKALVEYELGIANTLSLTTSRDSLKIVAAELKNRDYRLSRLSLPRRSFIPCEPVEIKGTTFYHTKNPIPHTKVYDYGTVYRVRIGLFKNRPNLTALKGVTPLSYTDAYNNGLYAYFVGTFPTEQGAQEAAAKLRNLGFKSPVVAVWVDGEYYPTVEDMRRTQNNYNLEISGISTLSEDIKAKILTHKADCTISRVGTSFVVGTFEGKSVAEAVATDLRAMGGGIEVTIVKKP